MSCFFTDSRLTAWEQVDLAASLGAKTIVWGSPKQRKLNGRSYAEAFAIAKGFFKELGTYAARKAVIVAMEVIFKYI